MTADPITLDPSQERAVDLICSAPFGVVTGGPGTGKSTCTRYALDRLDAAGLRYALAAPTGKASRRLFETTGRQTSTVHRLLEFSPRAGGFQRNAGNPLEVDVVAVDESSMLDVELAAALLDAIDATRTRLILIGDADQLPPVGPGRVFGDLVESGDVPVARLTTLHRSAQKSWIHVSAQRILRGELPDLVRRDDFRFVQCDEAGAVLPALRTLAIDTMPREIDAVSQVLIPQRPGPAGIDAANAMLQASLNPPAADGSKPELARAKGVVLRVGDRVIQTKNDYSLGNGGVFNGELGDVVDIGGGKVVVQYPDHGPVAYTLEQANALHLAYALTVHRFQGSEVPWAVVVVHSTHSYMLTRQLVYTAITRAKKGVVLVGNEKGLRVALSEKRPPKRNTALVERMRGELEERT